MYSLHKYLWGSCNVLGIVLGVGENSHEINMEFPCPGERTENKMLWKKYQGWSRAQW